ncbi:TetR/AcrR family transcriptional regulator [Streptomyces sp. NBC_01808]|uniref:TetR/AcrR family transcriptional regulator n=1 Tax=Streptomyces sp. NBC_01808 TaxID=2975947 RepID=UPI002DD87D10|nr:helix-turn-helix domain-containing protein [Streptomyces sp. NBC_01808]WSA38538.1 TetR/AcrR family transcriptional regulator [Streptomyces sp. NBC_01808]
MATVDGDLIPLERPRAERADAARNRRLLLDTARRMIAEAGAENVTMDGLAEQAGVGKGTVYRRFRTRAGIFVALLDEEERGFQQRVLSGPPPLGPGADPVDRLIAYGQGRITFLLDHHAVARAALGQNVPVPAGPGLTRMHIRLLLEQSGVAADHLDALTLQLAAALEGPVLLYLATPAQEEGEATRYLRALAEGWKVLVTRVCRR